MRNLFSAALGFITGSYASQGLKNAVPNPTLPGPSKPGKYRRGLRSNRTYLVDLALDTWKVAIEAAEWDDNPEFKEYYSLIREVLKRDGRLRAQVKTAVNKVLDEPWAIVDVKTKEIDKEATELLNARFFIDLLQACIESELYGTRLIELGEPVQTDLGWEFGPCYTIPQENINPKKGKLYLSMSDSEGVSYREAPVSDYLLEAGDPDDLGLFVVATCIAIRKNLALNDWSQSGEKFMDPVAILKTASDQDAELDRKEDYLRNLGRNAYAIIDDEDEIQLLERSGQNAYQLVQQLASFLNTEIAEAINGQSATTEQKSFVGSAQVQERVLDSFTTARMRNLMFWVNDVVFPKIMTADGGKYVYAKMLKGKKYMPLQFMKELRDPNLPDPAANPDPSNPQPGNPNPTPTPGAKKKGSPANRQRFDPITNQFHPS